MGVTMRSRHGATAMTRQCTRDFDQPTSCRNVISNPRADQLLNAQPVRFTSPVSRGHQYSTMAFESNISRSESDDTEFGKNTPCQRHITNPADPSVRAPDA